MLKTKSFLIVSKLRYVMAQKSLWGKIWYFIWEDDSIWSWIVNVIIAFILIKFIIYPGLGFALQTSHPIVAVVSGSMEHKMVNHGTYYDICRKQMDKKEHVNFERFWEICGQRYELELGITKDQFQEFSMKNGFNKGDIMILYSAKDIEVGDVIVYQGQSFPIIHRVVKIDQADSNKLVTSGDHNGYNDPEITRDKMIGKAVFRVPFLGYIKIWAVQFLCIFNHNMAYCGI